MIDQVIVLMRYGRRNHRRSSKKSANYNQLNEYPVENEDEQIMDGDFNHTMRLRHIEDYFWLSVLASIYFLPTGSWALVRSMQARDFKNPNNFVCWGALAKIYGRLAKKWLLITAAVGTLFYVLLLVIIYSNRYKPQLVDLEAMEGVI
ncbi:hypothetical protein ACOME3_000190 [Neoechinorhynchus agilis]